MLYIDKILETMPYGKTKPIKVNVLSDKMEIISHGGAMPPITPDDFKKERIVTMKYLNRRIGDFLRELHLTEGKGTGIPKIRRAMRNNGSDAPVFETDEARSYFLVTLPVKPLNVTVTPEIINKPANNGDKPATKWKIPANTTSQEKKVLTYLMEKGSVTSKQTEELLNVKTSRARELLGKMAQKNLIVKQGQRRSTHYILGVADD